MPSISIGLPVFNGEQFLREAVESILAQDFTDFELIISDNASTDGTRDICENYARWDSRIRYSRLPENLGAANNYNRVFELSSGKYFKWAAHDDVLYPRFLSRCLTVFKESREDVSLVHPSAEFIDVKGNIIGPDRDKMHADSRYACIRTFRALQSMNLTAPIFGVFNRHILARTRLIDSFMGSDYVLLLEAALLGRILQIQGECLFKRRIHPLMSRKANVTEKEVLKWFDPAARSALSSRRRFYVEYMRSALVLDELSVGARGVCALAVVCGVVTKRSRVVAGRLRRQLLGHPLS
jgi:glycosyltransferase involved in cell wall biosynthesis